LAGLNPDGPPVDVVIVAGAAHHNFSDLTYLGLLKMTGMLGPIDPLKAGEITEILVRDFLSAELVKGS